MREMVRLQVVPDPFDIIHFRRVLGQPLDGEPMGTGGECSKREFAGVYRTIVLDQDHRSDGLPGLRPVKSVQLLKMSDEVAAALAAAGVHDELARDVIERTEHGDLLGLSWRGNPQIGSSPRPGTSEIGMFQCLAFVTVEQNDVAGAGLLLAQRKTQADPFNLGRTLAAFQRVP